MSQVFSLLFLFKTLCFLTLELSILNLSLGSYFCEKNCLWSFEITKRVVCDLCDHQVYILSLLVLGFVRSSCVEEKKSGVVYSWFVFVISQWRSLCGRSCKDIVKILLCEGRDVEQWLEPRNISVCLRLDFLSNSLSLSLYLALLLLIHIHIHARYCSCAHTCVQLREFLKHLNS